MANPLGNEKEIYKKIKDEDIVVHPVVWELVNHHVRNDLYLVSIAAGSLRAIPVWILKAASFFIRFLYKVSFQPGPPPESLIKICDVSLKRVKEVDIFLKKLRELTS